MDKNLNKNPLLDEEPKGTGFFGRISTLFMETAAKLLLDRKPRKNNLDGSSREPGHWSTGKPRGWRDVVTKSAVGQIEAAAQKVIGSVHDRLSGRPRVTTTSNVVINGKKITDQDEIDRVLGEMGISTDGDIQISIGGKGNTQRMKGKKKKKKAELRGKVDPFHEAFNTDTLDTTFKNLNKELDKIGPTFDRMFDK